MQFRYMVQGALKSSHLFFPKSQKVLIVLLYLLLHLYLSKSPRTQTVILIFQPFANLPNSIRIEFETPSNFTHLKSN